MNTTEQTRHDFNLAYALQADRIPWSRVVAEGYSLRRIARDARLHGDEELYRRALRAANRRGL